MMVPCRNLMGSILWKRDKYNEIQKYGWKPNLYAQVDHLRFFPRTVKSDPKLQKMSRYPTITFQRNSRITLNGFQFKENDKGGQKSDKKGPKSL
jgi:hypothetical protein